MIEHVTVISQEAITKPLLWPVIVVASVGALFAIAASVAITNDHTTIADKRPINLLVHASACVPLMFLTMLICALWFPVETGQYKYEGTLDPDMTIVEFEEFSQQYANVRFEDGLWKWEDKQ